MRRFKGSVPTVMVVEDFDDTRMMIRRAMEMSGYGVVEACNGREAVEFVRQRCPDLILMDLNMPEMDGLTAAEQIRECREQCENVPIVAITAYDIYGMKEAAAEAGCNDYLTKPLDFEQLEKVVSGLLYS